MTGANRNFACSQCGACCNRAPEVELGEAAGLSDVFIWQLLFRLYSQPRAPTSGENSAQFYETKRLLTRFAAYSFDGKAMVNGRKEPRTFYLSVSALALDLGTGSCGALRDRSCSIYGRRPLTCRTVPLHYSRAETGAAADFDAFVASPGHACNFATDAPPLLSEGKIVAADLAMAREAAASQAETDRPWKAAIVKAMKAGSPDLPSLEQVIQNTAHGALIVPMRGAWRTALRAGLLEDARYEEIMAWQSALLADLAGQSTLGPAALQSIAAFRRAYADQG